MLAGRRVTRKTASRPSATFNASAMVNAGVASAAIVPRPVELASVVPEGTLSSTVNVSLGSWMSSRRIGTRMVFVVWFGLKVSVPDVWVKSASATAVPSTVE